MAPALRDGRFLVGTSWKMNKTRAEAVAWVETVHAGGALEHDIATFVAPPFTALDAVRGALDRPAIDANVAPGMKLGAQTMSDRPDGADTGEISAAMLVDADCGFVELGHSERRGRHGESDAAIARKVRLALDHGLTPLVCIGDHAPERDAGAGIDAVLRQAALALSEVDGPRRRDCVLAYEPVWAIGAGATPATPDAVARVLGALANRFPGAGLLYGGSVDADNAAALTRIEALDGLFVGRAALAPGGFLAILRAVADALSDRPPRHLA